MNYGPGGPIFDDPSSISLKFWSLRESKLITLRQQITEQTFSSSVISYSVLICWWKIMFSKSSSHLMILTELYYELDSRGTAAKATSTIPHAQYHRTFGNYLLTPSDIRILPEMAPVQLSKVPIMTQDFKHETLTDWQAQYIAFCCHAFSPPALIWTPLCPCISDGLTFWTVASWRCRPIPHGIASTVAIATSLDLIHTVMLRLPCALAGVVLNPVLDTHVLLRV